MDVIDNLEEPEIWKDVEGFPYQVSNKGSVKSLERKMSHSRNPVFSCIKKEKIISICNDGRGYKFAGLCSGSKRIYKKVHRLVAKAFISNPENKPQINHINGIKSDNRAENLEWVTCKENHSHAIKIGLAKNPVYDNRGEKNHTAKLNEMQVRIIRRLGEYNLTQEEIASYFPIKREQVSHIINRKNWKLLAG